MASPQLTSQERLATAASRPPAIELRRINKRFGAVHANRDIDLIVRPGTVHGIVGDVDEPESLVLDGRVGVPEDQRDVDLALSQQPQRVDRVST